MTWRRLSMWALIVAGAVAAIAFVLVGGWRFNRDSPEQRLGKYRVLNVQAGLFAFSCQPHQEIYFEDTYLASCGTPTFLGDRDQPSPDPNCFVFAEDNSSVAYWHIPNLCGSTSPAKAGGIYAHSAATGERLVFSDKNIHQQFGGPTERRGLQTGWAAPWNGPPRCRPILAVQADGVERALKPNDPLCQ